MLTVAAIAVAAVGFGVGTQHAGHIGALDKEAVEPLLSEVVELVGEDSAADSDGIVALLSDHSIEHFGEPPDT